MKSSFERILAVFCMIVLIGLSILGILTFKVNKTVEDTNQWVLHTHRVLFKAEQLLYSINNFEFTAANTRATASAKANLILQRDTLLGKLHTLEHLTRDNSHQQLRIKKLKATVKDRIDKSGIYGESSKAFFLTSQKLLNEIQKEENELLVARTKANNSSREALNNLFYGILFAGFLLLVTTTLALKKYLTLQKKSESTILQMNQNLEKRVEENANQLLEKEKQYQLFLDNLLEGAQIIDSEWQYIYVNKELAKQARFSAEEMLGSKMTDLFPGITETSIYKELREAMQSGIPRKVENLFHYPNGDVAYYELSIEPVKEGLFVLSMDITDRKINELYKEQYIAELEEVLFKISHEVRSPVVKILGVANLMELSLIKEDELPMIIDSMKSCALLLDRYTRELSDFVTEMKDNSTRG